MDGLGKWKLHLAILGLLVAAVLYFTVNREPKKESRPVELGWGADIDWVKTYEEGLMKSKSSLKPLMVIHHLLDCPFSIALKKAFAANAEIQKLAKEDFIMLNIVNETSDKNMAPDGYYVPRIILVDPSLTVRTDIVGKHKKNKYTYEPNDIPLLIENMKKAKMVLHKEL
nr:PREDICTED: anterior gradient protein 3-like [Latimeria chalumnae]|eukprot:XP_014343863.1 PREDICTED: anterior gradient protein 3-like [Latimeria chalumnae]